MDIVSAFSTAYGATKSIMEIGKGLLSAKINDEVKTKFRELLEQIGVFQEAQFLLREQLLKIQQDKIDLKAEVDELQAKLDLKSKVKFIKPCYWIIDGEEKDGPFCPQCYDVDGNLVHLQDYDNSWYCIKCQFPFYTEEQRSRPSPRDRYLPDMDDY